jgi:hypothetical protein
MGQLAIILPVVLQARELLELTWRCVQSLRSSHPCRLYVSPNRLTLLSVCDLAAECRRLSGWPTVVMPVDQNRALAGSWNECIRMAAMDGCSRYLLVGMDCKLEPDCIDHLMRYGDSRPDSVALWSGVSTVNARDRETATEGVDFSCVMLDIDGYLRHGPFDENFRPAYYEDNDYHARVALAGESARVVHAARFEHRGSATIRHDAEMAHHVRHWWPMNKQYFVRKWGAEPVNREAEMRRVYHTRPFGQPEHPLSYWPRLVDRPYSGRVTAAAVAL